MRTLSSKRFLNSEMRKPEESEAAACSTPRLSQPRAKRAQQALGGPGPSSRARGSPGRGFGAQPSAFKSNPQTCGLSSNAAAQACAQGLKS
mmetsp:Transcript_4877/g.7831  ORF Transcript_4877/g.7831 Transcript_4877/m.7831 type:complete len:91 (+) Transcript_4877:2171-2443(+)